MGEAGGGRQAGHRIARADSCRECIPPCMGQARHLGPPVGELGQGRAAQRPTRLGQNRADLPVSLPALPDRHSAAAWEQPQCPVVITLTCVRGPTAALQNLTGGFPQNMPRVRPFCGAKFCRKADHRGAGCRRDGPLLSPPAGLTDYTDSPSVPHARPCATRATAARAGRLGDPDGLAWGSGKRLPAAGP